MKGVVQIERIPKISFKILTQNSPHCSVPENPHTLTTPACECVVECTPNDDAGRFSSPLPEEGGWVVGGCFSCIKSMCVCARGGGGIFNRSAAAGLVLGYFTARLPVAHQQTNTADRRGLPPRNLAAGIYILSFIISPRKVSRRAVIVFYVFLA